MAYKPSRAQRLVLTLTLNLETEAGGRPSTRQMSRASECLVEAVRLRLFGDGFLPPDVCVDTYGMTVD